MKQYLAEVILYQRGPIEYTAEERIIEVKTMKCISKRLFDVLVYDCCTVKGKHLYSWIPFEPSRKRENESEIEI